MIYCDKCGEPEGDADFKAYAELPYDVESACAGESGVVCDECDEELQKKPSKENV